MFELTAPMAIFVMCIVTFMTRVGGLLVMSVCPITPRVVKILDGLTGSTLVAMILPSALSGDQAGIATILVAGAVMVLSKNTLAAMLAGIVAAAVFRLYI